MPGMEMYRPPRSLGADPAEDELAGLLEAVAGRAEGAFTILYARLWHPVHTVVRRALADPGLAEDITQECFLRLFAELRAGTRIDHVKAWLFRVAHNLSVDEQRRYEGRAESLDEEALQKADDQAVSTEEAMLHQERLVRMRAAMDRLSAQQRACLLLRAENFRYREIADLLGITKSTVFENIRRGLTHLTKDCQ